MPSIILPASDVQNLASDRVSALARHKTFWLHGAGLAGDTWEPLTAGLPHALTPDLPGHGIAAMIKPPRVETYADALSDLVPQGSVVIGHSLGGMVALELSARLQDRIKALILIETVPTVRDRLTGRISANVAAGLFQSIPTAWLAWLSGIGQSPATRAELRRQMARTDRARVSAALEASARYDGRWRLPQINVPTLLIVGKQNTATHHGTRVMANHIRGAQLLKLPGGHMLHTDNPVQLRRSIDGFVSQSVSQLS